MELKNGIFKASSVSAKAGAPHAPASFEFAGASPKGFWLLCFAKPIVFKRHSWNYGLAVTRLSTEKHLRAPIANALAAVLLVDEEQAQSAEWLQSVDPAISKEQPWIFGTVFADTPLRRSTLAVTSALEPFARRRAWLAPLVCVPVFAAIALYALSNNLAGMERIETALIATAVVGFLSSGTRLFTAGAWTTWIMLDVYGIALISMWPFIAVAIAAGVGMLLLSLALRFIVAGKALSLRGSTKAA